jgi:hypothetical protein
MLAYMDMQIKRYFCIQKERKKSLTRGHVKDIGSTVGMPSYRG